MRVPQSGSVPSKDQFVHNITSARSTQNGECVLATLSGSYVPETAERYSGQHSALIFKSLPLIIKIKEWSIKICQNSDNHLKKETGVESIPEMSLT